MLLSLQQHLLIQLVGCVMSNLDGLLTCFYTARGVWAIDAVSS